MKQIVTSIVVAGILLTVLLGTDDLLTRLIVLPFLVFAVSLVLHICEANASFERRKYEKR